MRITICILAFILLACMSCISSNPATVKVLYSDPLHKDSVVMVYAIPTIAPIQKIVKPEIYNLWWAETEACSHLTISDATRDKIEYYAVNSEGFVLEGTKDGGKLRFGGYSDIWNNKMYLVLQGVDDPELVKHEMLHFLMYHNGLPVGHPRFLFLGCNLNPS